MTSMVSYIHRMSFSAFLENKIPHSSAEAMVSESYCKPLMICKSMHRISQPNMIGWPD